MATVLRTMLDILTAGNKEEETEQKDGHITSILLVTSFSAIVFAFFGEEFYTHSKWLFSVSNYKITEVIMFGLMLLSLLIWILLCCLAKYRASSCLSVPRNDPVSSVVCILYGIFGLGKLIIPFLVVIIEIGCYKEDSFDAVIALECVLYIIYLCVQIISIWRFSRFQFKRNLLINYSLSVILLTHVVFFLWRSFADIYRIPLMEKTYANQTTSSNQTKGSCISASSIAIHFLLPLNGVTYMFALQQEYSLLSICLTASIFPGIGSIPNVNRNHVVGIENTDDISQPQAVIKVHVKQRRQFEFGCKSILIALSSTAVFIPGLVVLIIKEICSFNDGLFFISPLCVALPSSTVIVFMMVGFHFLRKADIVERILENSNEYLMDYDAIFILSAVGAIVRKCIVLFFSTTIHDATINVNALACILLILEIYYRTIFIISLRTINIKRDKTLQCVVLWLILPNFLWWMYDRFISLKPNFDESHELMLSFSWPFLRHTIHNVSGFYRFQSFVLLYRKWKTRKSEMERN